MGQLVIVFVLALVLFVAGYLVAKFKGPQIDKTAGVIVHDGEAYYHAVRSTVGREMRYLQSKVQELEALLHLAKQKEPDLSAPAFDPSVTTPTNGAQK